MKHEEDEETTTRPTDHDILDVAGELYRLAVMYGHYLSEAEECDDESDAEGFTEAADDILAEFLEELEKAAAELREKHDVGMDDDEEDGDD